MLCFCIDESRAESSGRRANGGKDAEGFVHPHGHSLFIAGLLVAGPFHASSKPWNQPAIGRLDLLDTGTIVNIFADDPGAAG